MANKTRHNVKDDGLGFEFNLPNPLIILGLLVVLVGEIGLVYEKIYQIQDGLFQSFDVMIFLLTWYALLTTPLADLIRNIYVLFAWIVICTLYCLYKFDKDVFTAIVPFGVLFYSQICRFTFKCVMGYYPIHLLFDNLPFHRFSKINNRKSTKVDFWYSSIYAFVGILLTVIFGMMNLKK